MKKILLSIAILFMLSACTTAPFMPAQGLVYTNTKAPLSIGFHKTELGNKVGTATSYSVLSLFSFGDVSAQAAARNGRIRIMKYADYEFTNVFFLFSKTTLYVYGE